MANGGPESGTLRACILDGRLLGPGLGGWTPNHSPTLPFGGIPAPVAPAPFMPVHTHYHFTPAPLSDSDVERIAKRVAELLREPKP